MDAHGGSIAVERREGRGTSFVLSFPKRAFAKSAPAAAQSIRITVSEKRFEPSRVTARAGSALRLTFVRTSDATCATEVTVPAFTMKRALPLNQPVEVELTPQKSGDIEFVCGMGMLRGTIVVP